MRQGLRKFPPLSRFCDPEFEFQVAKLRIGIPGEFQVAKLRIGIPGEFQVAKLRIGVGHGGFGVGWGSGGLYNYFKAAICLILASNTPPTPPMLVGGWRGTWGAGLSDLLP